MSSSSDAIEELRLPQTVISRLVKDALPPGIIVSKEARTAIARAASVFILHASTYAQDCAVANKRKTVTAADVLSAMKTLECDDLIKPVRNFTTDIEDISDLEEFYLKMIKEAVELWKSNKQQKLDDAKKRKAEREKLGGETGASTSLTNVDESIDASELSKTDALANDHESSKAEIESNSIVDENQDDDINTEML
ncbi:unnamed protein product [Anisakis simplex]|uniref:DNA polymerase epsilon subunit 3 n=1 Tax=Anisakis simplex TaxID=6269 RepID=A0A0M3K1I0_ANISI|nr:unnamed protein product [Anisakis simplex]